jgi:drug/metabolite transporter (DMT)-like permease
MAAAAFFLSLMALTVRVVGQRLPTMEVVMARSVVVLVLSWGLMARRGIAPLGHARRRLLLRGILGFVALSCYYYGLIHLPLADATVIHYTNPIWTAVFAAAILSETIGLKELAFSAASLGGVVIMARPSALFAGDSASALPSGPVLVALFGALLSGGAYVTVRALGRTDHPLVVVFWLALVSTIGGAPFLIGRTVIPGAADLLLLALVGVTTFVGQLFITMGLREERAGRAMSVAYLQVVFAGVWGILFLGEYLDAATVTGAAVVLLSTWAVSRRPLTT